ncbi:MAG: tetratricopeptide repeat protein, partial [Cyanobium sp.]
MPSRSRRSPKAAANPPAPAGEASGLDTAVLQQAIDRHLAGHPAEAEPVYERFVAAGLGYTAAYTNLAAIELARGRADRAIALWQSALRIDENLPDCWYDLGNEWRRRGDTNAARRHLERAVELRPGFAEARCNLSSLLIALADADAALAQAEAALKLRPDFLEAAVNRTTALRLLGRLEEAEASARRAVELAPSSALALGALGSVLRDRDCLVEAEQVLRRALVGEPLSPELSINLAMVLQKQGRLDDGVAVLAAASAQHRDRGDLFSQLGQLQFMAGRYLEAMQAYRRQAALQPRLAEVHYNLAVVLKEMGQLEASAAAYQQALHCQPDHENALHGLSYTLNFGQLESMPRLAARLRAWTRRHYPAEDLTPFLGRRLPLAGGKLRIGFLSAEIGRHAVAWFLGSVLEHLDRDSFEVFLYESADRQGDGEEREALTRLATATVQLHGMDDAAARQRILADQIDVLVDTTAC